MKIYETLERDPRKVDLANRGQARISGDRSAEAIAELRQELESFVCDGEYGRALKRVLSGFLQRYGTPRQDAVWVSGFFGSGKSHLLKMLGHLWADTPFPDGATARSLVRSLPDEVVASLRELDTLATRAGVRTLAAAGTLPAGSGDFVRCTVLSIILRACELPEQYPQAMFCFWLRENGHLEGVRKEVEAAGKTWLGELNNLYVSPLIARALLKRDAGLGRDEREARQAIRAQFPPQTTDLTTTQFLDAARKALGGASGKLPLTILVLDEVQQYIGDSIDRAVAITELAEAIQAQMDSRVLLVGSGQSALSANTPLLQKMRDRFRVTVQLTDADVEAVTRKVLLGKKPSGTKKIMGCLEENAGEISKHLRGSKIAPRNEDQQTILADYPLLPSRRRFWEECFRAVDAAGTHSQLRSQLRILHDALLKIADRDVGGAIPADALYDAIAPDLVNTGVLLNELSTRIQQLDDGTPKGKLRRRLCALVFLIGKLPRESAADPGVRSTAAMIADLLVDDLTSDTGPLRKEAEKTLEALVEAGTLMRVGDEYRLQTTEGAEWDRAFREKAAAVGQNEVEIAARRDDLFSAAVQQIVSEVKLLHGASKVSRKLKLHVGLQDPPPAADSITPWLRDNWSIGQNEVLADARRRGQDDPLIHVFLPKKSADELRTRIVEAEACQKVIDLKGAPTGNEGKEARASMESRRRAAETSRDEIVREIVRSAKVYQGGGSEVFGADLQEKLTTAANASISRLFPRFPEADHAAWEPALKRAKDGSDEPFKVVDWTRPTAEHPVAKEVIAIMGSGSSGTKIRTTLKAAPYGWSQDAIDATLIALHRAGVARATANGQLLAPGHLDQNRIASAEFRPERVVLTVQQRLTVRGLYGQLDIPVKSGEEEAKAAIFLDRLTELANAAGGDAPMPSRPDTAFLDALRSLAGPEQLAAFCEKRKEVGTAITRWKKLSERAATRRSLWDRSENLAGHAAGLGIMREVGPEIEAICEHRSLLDDADHVTPLIARLAGELRAEVAARHEAMLAAWTDAEKTLGGERSWMAVTPEQQAALRERHGLGRPTAPIVRTDEELLTALDRQSLAARADAVAAVPERVRRVIEEAARLLKPEARRVALQPATLQTEAEVKAWIAAQEKTLLDAVKKGPVVVG